MEIQVLELHSQEELFNKLTHVTLPNNVNIYNKDTTSFIYKRTNPSQELYPAQYYLIKEELDKVKELNYALLDNDIDLFDLNGYVTIEVDNDVIDVLPPIVEKVYLPNGDSCYTVNDGMHRVYLSMLEHRNLHCVFIASSLFKEYPYYAYPIPFGPGGYPNWNKLQIFEGDCPDGFVKRWPRIKNHKSLYRNFNSVFNGVSGRHTKKVDPIPPAEY